MENVIVLVMHGEIPRDFPKGDLIEFFSLHTRMHTVNGAEREALERRHSELEAKLRSWPRTLENDPFFAGSQELAAELSRVTGLEVIVAFNEFCAPSTEESVEQAIQQGAGRILMLTTMMSRGGSHSEREIPEALQHMQTRHPDTPILYIWPYDVSEVAQFLASQLRSFLEKSSGAPKTTPQ